MKNITQHDLDLLKILCKDTGFSRLAYLMDKSKEITMDSYDEKRGVFKGSYEWIDIFGTFDEMNKTQEVEFQFDHVSFIPNNTNFEGFKEDLIIEPLKDPSEVNKPIVDKLIEQSGLSLSELPENAEIIFNDYAMVFCLRCVNTEHPYVTIYNGQLIKFDSLDCALKLPYEQARVTMKYLPKESRNMLDNWKDYLESDDFSEEMENSTLQCKEVVKATRAYYNSDTFKSDLAKAKSIMMKEGIGQIESQDYVYGPTPTLNEKTFWGLVDAAFQENEHDTDPNCDFRNEFVDVDGLRFFKMYGQGTFTAIRLLD